MKTEILQAFQKQPDFQEVGGRNPPQFIRIYFIGDCAIVIPDLTENVADHYNFTKGLIFSPEGESFQISPAFAWINYIGTLEQITSAPLTQDFGPSDARTDKIRHNCTIIERNEFSRWFDDKGVNASEVALTPAGTEKLKKYCDWFKQVGPNIPSYAMIAIPNGR